MSNKKYSKVITLHYIRLIYRSILFICALIWYIRERVYHNEVTLNSLYHGYKAVIFPIIWAVFMGEMILRFLPNNFESPGTQKVFKKNFVPSGKKEIKIQDNNATVIVALVWVIPNGIIGALYMTGILDQGMMLLLCLAYSICDIICILFFCPFQSWFLKNKCCSTCRIYNWDFPFMFTPLFFVPGIYTWSLLWVSLLLLARWEITAWKHPERFSQNTNAYLRCSNCNEKLCIHKKQLSKLMINNNQHSKSSNNNQRNRQNRVGKM